MLKNDFLVKPELSASRVLLSLPRAAVHAPVASAPVALPAEGRGHIRYNGICRYIKVLIFKGCYNIIYAELIIIMMYILRGTIIML